MITNERYNHIIAVARLMMDETLKKYPDDEKKAEDMFVLGLLHDIGYEFGDNLDHNDIGGHILERQNYKYFNEVKYHGVCESNYQSNELDLLNYADMHINARGDYVSFDERLEDIKNRRGGESQAYISSKKIIDELIMKGYK